MTHSHDLEDASRSRIGQFSHFCSLLEHISRLKPKSARTPSHIPSSNAALYTFERWAGSLKSQNLYPKGLGSIIFRLLFPEDDAHRKYDLQEVRLSALLQQTLDIGTIARQGKIYSSDICSSALHLEGCLGNEVRYRSAQRRTNYSSPDISLEDVDHLLDELASHSPFSVSFQLAGVGRRPRKEIIGDLYRNLTPFGAACITQIILKDLRPILYPLPSTSTTSNLLSHKSNAHAQLNLYACMKIWHPLMPSIYKTAADLCIAAARVDDVLAGKDTEQNAGLRTGIPMDIPKCLKGESCERVIRLLQSSKSNTRVWAETKYDGERMQIHVDLSLAPNSQIKIFSKSKRDSTLDRWATHPIIRTALGLISSSRISQSPSTLSPGKCASPKRAMSSAILEAEMVCFNESTSRIDEFWKIRALIESTAQGGRGLFNSGRARGIEESRHDHDLHQESLESLVAGSGKLHLMLIFFDILHIDGEDLVRQTYECRRQRLEQVITVMPGFSVLARRVPINLSVDDALSRLEGVFAQHIADFEEGLVLKPAFSTYNDMRSGYRWIKLKKDYIQGLGDTIDLAVVGASWEKDRGRELGVGPETYTTFWLGAIDKAAEKARRSRERVKIDVLFTASYGLSREQLEDFNWQLRDSKSYPAGGESSKHLSYTVEFAKGLSGKPSILLSEPRLVEVMGAGFTKSPGSKHYELRFPRITKVFRTKERSWVDGVDLHEFHRIACAAVGRDPPPKRSSDAMKKIWDLPISPNVCSEAVREQRLDRWLAKLRGFDTPAPKRKADVADLGSESPAPMKKIHRRMTTPVLGTSDVQNRSLDSPPTTPVSCHSTAVVEGRHDENNPSPTRSLSLATERRPSIPPQNGLGIRGANLENRVSIKWGVLTPRTSPLALSVRSPEQEAVPIQPLEVEQPPSPGSVRIETPEVVLEDLDGEPINPLELAKLDINDVGVARKCYSFSTFKLPEKNARPLRRVVTEVPSPTVQRSDSTKYILQKPNSTKPSLTSHHHLLTLEGLLWGLGWKRGNETVLEDMQGVVVVKPSDLDDMASRLQIALKSTRKEAKDLALIRVYAVSDYLYLANLPNGVGATPLWSSR